jgi:flagellar assembly protein FliH
MKDMSLVFNRDFDLELAHEDQQSRRDARARHTPEELTEAITAARAAAFAEGRTMGRFEGLAEAAAADEARRVAALAALMPQMTSLMLSADTHRAALEAQLLDFSLSVCEQVFPELLKHRAHDRALAQLRRALSIGLGSATLRIALSPEGLRLLREDLDTAITESGLLGRVELLSDPALADGDVCVRWDSGFLEYSYASICNRILRVLREARTATPSHFLEP